ncbi:MAG: ATP-binding protein [Bacteroidales bacterium]|nr:ATP-binding protein [Bacteroidales bacterium]
MILQIRIGNMYSIHQEMTLDLQAASLQTRRAKQMLSHTFTQGDERALKSVAIFGANAAGKSSMIKAIKACRDIIKDSHNYNADTRFGYEPFKFGGQQEPSQFEIRFLLDGVEYEYGFTFTPEKILTEYLYTYPKGRKAIVFTRDESLGPDKKAIYTFRSALKKPLDVATNTSDKTLFLSRGSQMDRPILKEVYQFLTNGIVVKLGGQDAALRRRLAAVDKQLLLTVLKTADSDIVDYEILPDRITTTHSLDANVKFDFATEESAGTIKLVDLALLALEVIADGKLLVIDELESSLHSALAQFIVDAFNKSECAQLVFTTHSRSFLDLEHWRRDQIYFVNKLADGSSDLYSLFDYKRIDEDSDIAKAYDQGRFDAVPYVGEPEVLYLSKKKK